jgi:hypothetical protein
MGKTDSFVVWSLLLLSFCRLNTFAQEQTGSKSQVENTQQEHLEFSHPLVTESVSPDTKIRSTFLNTKSKDNSLIQTYDLELEYSPVPTFSLHLNVPYTVLKPAGNDNRSSLDEIELALKFANFAFESDNILMGYGVSFGLPSGNEAKGIGSDHIWNINPFFNGGIIWKRWEWTAYFTFTIPANQSPDENIQTGLESRLTALYHIGKKWEALAEAGNTTQISNFDTGEKSYDLTEGIKFRPNPDKPWILALGVRHPVSGNNGFKWQGIMSVFYHFMD